MDVIHRELLLRHREALVSDVLQPESLLPYLLSQKILSHEDSNLIQAQVTPQARMRQLLDLLPQRGAAAFPSFCNALETNYIWLSELLSSQAEAVISQSQGEQPNFKEELFLDARLRGGVPLPPSHFVTRHDQVQLVREKLKHLGHRQGLVLHGMTGSGKSCLAAAALDCKELVLGTFKGIVLWVSMGDGILPAQLTLLNKLDRHWPLAPPQQNTTHLPVPNTEDVAREALRARILSNPPELKHGLLVLDDVTSRQAANAFDIGCRILLLTQDISVIEHFRSKCFIIEMVNGFTESESLELLASSVDMNPLELWPQAKDIHSKSHGFPLMISLIGGLLAQFKEDARSNDARWQQYSDMLSRHRRSRRNSLSRPGLMEAISQSLDTLTPELKLRYYQLVVFEEDVNILPEVLSTLWGVCKYEVEENMLVLLRKSLASRRWNEELRSYVYGVHYLLLHFLQTNLSDQDVKGNHAQLVYRYEGLVCGDWGALPKDNYAHVFLASHIVRAGLGRALLPKVLLSLSFVAARLRISLPGDLLRDFQRLRECLDEKNADQLTELEHYESFVRRWGDVIWRRSYLDPIQCALQEPVNSKVRLAGLGLVRQHQKYFLSSRVQMTLQVGGGGDSNGNGGSLEVPGDFSTGTLCCHHLLLAYQNGSIQMWDLNYSRSLHHFPGLTSPAIKLCVSSDHKSLAAASAIGEVFLWRLPSSACVCKDGATSTPPPQLLQWMWQPLHGNITEAQPVKLETETQNSPSCCLDFGENGDMLAWCSPDRVRVWKLINNSPVVLWDIDKLSNAMACAFGLEDSVLLIAAGDIYLCKAETGTILNVLPANNPSYLAPLRKIANANYSSGWCFELSMDNLSMWEWWSLVDGESWHPTKQSLNIEDKLASVAMSPDQSLVAVVNEDSQLYVWQRASLALLLSVAVPQDHPLLALGCASPTSVRALLGGVGSVTVLDLHLDSSPYSITHPTTQPVWCHSGHQWAAQLYPNGDLRVLCGKTVSVAKKVTSITAESQLLVVGTGRGVVASLMPWDLVHKSPQIVGKLESAITHLSCYQEWIVAATESLQLVVFGHGTTNQCLGLAAPVIQTYLVWGHSLWLLVCTAYGLQAWNIGWVKSVDGTRQQCIAFDLAPIQDNQVLLCAFNYSQNIIAMATSQQKVQVGRFVLDSNPTPCFVPLHHFNLTGDATAISFSAKGNILAVAVSSNQLLQVWGIEEGRILAEACHEAAESVGQIFITEDVLVTGGSFLAWWKLPKPPNFELGLLQVLQMQGQRGLLSFAPAPGSRELLVCDARGSLKIVRPVSSSFSPTQHPGAPYFPFPQNPTSEVHLNIEEVIQKASNGTSH